VIGEPLNPVAWVVAPILGGLINGLIELLTIKFIWKEKFSYFTAIKLDN
jgi:phosphate/sulfate permease